MVRSIVIVVLGFSIACLDAGCGGDDCKPKEDIICLPDSGSSYWIDSCGDVGEVFEDCPCGCMANRSGCAECECYSDLDCGANEFCNRVTWECQVDCTPSTCQSEGYDCGNWSDGCGGQIICGNCPNNFTCNASGGCDCLNHSACDATSICIYGDCLAAYGRRYEFTIRSADISQYNQAGDSWDFPGGMPDPFVCAYLNEVGEHCTSAVADTFTATFNSSFQADIYAADLWTFVAFDEDLASNDEIGGVNLDPIRVSTIKDGGFVWNSTYLVELVVDITPVQ